MKKENLLKRYPLVWAWGKYMGSTEEYILSEIEKAVEEKAPMTAIYKDYITSDWRVLKEVDSTEAKKFLKNFVAEEFGWELEV